MVFDRPDLSRHCVTAVAEFMVVLSDPSNHITHPAILRGENTSDTLTVGGIGMIYGMDSTVEFGVARIATRDARATAPKLGGANIAPPPDLDTLALVPAGTYCAAALTSEVKSDPDGLSTGIITLLLHK